MSGLLSITALPPFTMETALSVASATVTGYFWFMKARQERPWLSFHQLRGFRTSLRRHQMEKGMKVFSFMQVEPCGVLVTNNSIRPNSIVRFDCFFYHDQFWHKGRWGYVNDDMPPWNLPPQTGLAISLACFFDVPEDFEAPDDVKVKVEFITAAGKRFPHTFTLQPPED